MQTTKLSAKEYLRELRRQLRNIDIEIKAKLEEREWVRSMATRTGSSLQGDWVSGTKNITSKVENYVVKLVTLDEIIDRSVANLATLKSEALSKIDILEVSDHRTVLTLRYVKGMIWDAISVYMHFSYRHTLRIHGAALTEFEKFYKST